MYDNDDEDGMEMPCMCSHCGKMFDLNDGVGSEKWYPNEVICEACGEIETKEIERDEELEEIVNLISDAEWQLKDARKRLLAINENPDNHISYKEC